MRLALWRIGVSSNNNCRWNGLRNLRYKVDPMFKARNLVRELRFPCGNFQKFVEELDEGMQFSVYYRIKWQIWRKFLGTRVHACSIGFGFA